MVIQHCDSITETLVETIIFVHHFASISPKRRGISPLLRFNYSNLLFKSFDSLMGVRWSFCSHVYTESYPSNRLVRPSLQLKLLDLSPQRTCEGISSIMYSSNSWTGLKSPLSMISHNAGQSTEHSPKMSPLKAWHRVECRSLAPLQKWRILPTRSMYFCFKFRLILVQILMFSFTFIQGNFLSSIRQLERSGLSEYGKAD